MAARRALVRRTATALLALAVLGGCSAREIQERAKAPAPIGFDDIIAEGMKTASPEVQACMRVVPVGAYLGNPLLLDMWERANGLGHTLVSDCEHLEKDDPAAIRALADLWEQMKVEHPELTD